MINYKSVKTELETKVRGLGEIYISHAPFDAGINALLEKGANIISASELAYARLKMGESSTLSTESSYVKEGILYDAKNNRKILLRKSLVLDDPSSATKAHGTKKNFENKEYCLNRKFDVESFLGGLPKEDFMIYVPSEYNFVSTREFGENEYTAWLFREQAEDYGLFLMDAGINQIRITTNGSYDMSCQKRPFANQLELTCLNNDSEIDCRTTGLWANFNPVRGVSVTSEALAEKNMIETLSNEYLPNLKTVLNYEGINGRLEKTIISGFKRTF